MIKTENWGFACSITQSIPGLIRDEFPFHLIQLSTLNFQFMFIPEHIQLVNGHITIFSEFHMVLLFSVTPALRKHTFRFRFHWFFDDAVFCRFHIALDLVFGNQVDVVKRARRVTVYCLKVRINVRCLRVFKVTSIQLVRSWGTRYLDLTSYFHIFIEQVFLEFRWLKLVFFFEKINGYGWFLPIRLWFDINYPIGFY